MNKQVRSFSVFNPGSLGFICLCIILLATITINAQTNRAYNNSLRRQFIIAYDIRSAEDPDNQINSLLLSLFSESGAPYNQELNLSESFKNEIKEGKLFFNSSTDAISFFHFGVLSHDLAFIRGAITDSPKDSNLINKTFIDYFIKNTEISFSSNGKSGTADYERVKNVFRSFFDKNPNDSFNSGYSNQSFVFPFVLTNLSENTYASEYFLIIVGPNDSPAHNDNLFYPLPDDGRPALNLISKHQKYLSSFLDTIPYFSALIKNSKTQTHNAPPTLILKGFKIVPNSNNYCTNSQEYSIESNIYLSQPFLATTKFRISSADLKSKLNDHFSLKVIDLSILNENGDRTQIILDTALDTKTNNKWESNVLSNTNVNITDLEQIIHIPEFQIKIPALYQDQNFNKLLFKYTLYNQYRVTENLKINYIYTAYKSVNKQNIQFSSQVIRIIMFYIIPTIILLMIFFSLILFGKPMGIVMRVEGYLDSFEVIDYYEQGRINTPYKYWNTNEDHLMVYGKVLYKRPKYIFNWNPKILIKIRDSKLIPGFEFFIKQSVSLLNEYSAGNVMLVSMGKNNQFSFVIGIRQNDITIQVKQPQLLNMTIEGIVLKSILFFKCEKRKEIEYKFHLGPDLGEVWVGFDPGTTGSCIAVGSSPENIILGKDRIKQDIIPSIIVFDISENYKPNGTELPENIYKHGNLAKPLFGTQKARYKGFRSIKKLLGYKDIKEITFQNNNILKLNGKDLASLLVKGLFNDVITYFEKASFKTDEYLRFGKFNPQRAVVAIPNNFTINKIQDMIGCIENLRQFTEIRFVYEAEAVLFYYLSNYRRLNNTEDPFKQETILVFDMGGATLNATVVNANKIQENNRTKYRIDLLGKIGYGIGGDTINYCLAKTILSFINEFPEFKGINTMDKIIPFANSCEDIKKELSRMFYETSEPYLFVVDNLQDIISSALGTSIKINPETSEFYSYFKREKNNKCKLFTHPELQKTIYDNVIDSIAEVIKLSGSINIDKIIFSGRSTFFPMIKETVEGQMKSQNMNTISVILNLEESKTAVAKGTCWYGINRNAVQRNNLKTNASFGFKKTLGDIPEYYELVKMGSTFDVRKEGTDSFSGVKKISDSFDFDGNKVNFYQIMGKDANKIIEENQKHKFSKVASIILPQITSEVAMKVNENDDIECAVRLVSNQKIVAKGVVADQEIYEENEDHYTWVVK